MRFLPLIALAVLLSFLTPERAWTQKLTCTPCTLKFGNVIVGKSSTLSLQLKNAGTKSLSITYETKSGRSFAPTKLVLPYTLKPGASVQMSVKFAPQTTGLLTGKVVLKSTALVHWLILNFSGTGGTSTATGPQLTVAPSTLSFGNVTVGKSATLAATLSASNGSVTISSDQLTSSEFSIVGLKLPLTIPSGQKLQTSVRFTPNQSGTASGKVGYFSNAVVSPTVEQLTGNGVALSSHSVDLTWLEGASVVVGYNIYRGTVHGGPYSRINTALDASSTYTDRTVLAGKTYYYVTTAVDGSGKESPHSNEARAVIPSP